MIGFQYRGRRLNVEGGSITSCGAAIDYNDVGSDLIWRMLSDPLFENDWRGVVRRTVSSDWVYRIIVDARRFKFFDEVVRPSDACIVDIGSGWGQLAIPLAVGNRVIGIEANRAKAEFAKRVARIENVEARVAQVVGNIEDIDFDAQFDLAIINGVLEWYPKYARVRDGMAAQIAVLRKAHSWLLKGGKLVIGIENRLGLKYLLGAPDDHNGSRYTCMLEAPDAAEKYRREYDGELESWVRSYDEYMEMLGIAGFEKIETFYPFPDYKMPDLIFREDEESLFAESLSRGLLPDELNGYDGSQLGCNYELKSLYRSLTKAGIIKNFVPSFYFIAHK